jgi:hypothetical protein
MNLVETFRRIYEFGWVAVASAISSAVFNKWSSSVSAVDYTYTQMAIHGGGSFLIWLVLLTVPFWFINVPRIRHWLFPHSMIEGWWLQQVDIQDRPWSLSHLTKNIGFGWDYSGYAYDSAGKVAATWNSADAKLDDHAGFWIFKGESHRLNSSGAPTRTGNVLSVLYSKQYCEAIENDSSAHLPGRITDLDYEDLPTAASITLVRVTKEDWQAANISHPSTRLPPDQFSRIIEQMKRTGKIR